MDKITVNNQVIRMRHIVKMAKVRVINKLVKDIKSLQVKKGTDIQIEKNQRKVGRLRTEIAIIKKINNDEVSRKALLKEKDWNAVLQCKESSLEDRSFSMMASNKALQEEVEKFYKNEPKLIPLLPELFKEWESKKGNPDTRHFKNLKASEFRKRRKLQNKGQNNKSHIMFNEKNTSPKTEKGCNKSIKIGQQLPLDHSLSNKSSEIENEKDENINKLKAAVFSLNLEEMNDLSFVPFSNHSASETENPKDSSENGNLTLKDRDPFFCSPDDVSVAAKESIQARLEDIADESIDIIPPPRHFQRHNLGTKRFQKKNSFSNGFHKDMSRSNKNKFNRTAIHKETYDNKKFKHNSTKFSEKFAAPKISLTQKSAKFSSKTLRQSLHPSWEAKKKLKQSFCIVPSQGKKIIFD